MQNRLFIILTAIGAGEILISTNHPARRHTIPRIPRTPWLVHETISTYQLEPCAYEIDHYNHIVPADEYGISENRIPNNRECCIKNH